MKNYKFFLHFETFLELERSDVESYQLMPCDCKKNALISGVAPVLNFSEYNFNTTMILLAFTSSFYRLLSQMESAHIVLWIRWGNVGISRRCISLLIGRHKLYRFMFPSIHLVKGFTNVLLGLLVACYHIVSLFLSVCRTFTRPLTISRCPGSLAPRLWVSESHEISHFWHHWRGLLS